LVNSDGVLEHGEGYTRLKDNILYMNADGNIKVIQVESALSAEGKTTVVANLAVCLGATEKRSF
jgi:Mrp family chromosome partitioning ATPase